MARDTPIQFSVILSKKAAEPTTTGSRDVSQSQDASSVCDQAPRRTLTRRHLALAAPCALFTERGNPGLIHTMKMGLKPDDNMEILQNQHGVNSVRNIQQIEGQFQDGYARQSQWGNQSFCPQHGWRPIRKILKTKDRLGPRLGGGILAGDPSGNGKNRRDEGHRQA